MENLSQYAQIGIVAGAFLLGCLLAWLLGRSGRRRMETDYAGRLQSAQTTLKRREDDLETVRAQLAAQRDRAEQLAADRAALQAKWEQAEQAHTEAVARAEELDQSLAQALEERDRAAAEQVQALIETQRAERPAGESERVLAAEPAAQPAPDTAPMQVQEPPRQQEEASPKSAEDAQPSVVQDVPAQELQEPQAAVPSDSVPPAESGAEDVEESLVEARAQVITLSEGVNALTAMAVELAAALHQREQEIETLRSRMGRAALQEQPADADTSLAQPEGDESRSQLMAQLHARDAEVSALNKLLGQAQDESYKLADEKIGLETQLQAREAEISALNILLGQVQNESDKLADAKADLETLLQARDADILALNEELEQTLSVVQTAAVEQASPAAPAAPFGLPDVTGRTPSKAAAIYAAWILDVETGDLLEPQDLNEVNGIGAIFEQRLYSAGVGTYWELANLADEEMQRILQLDNLEQLRVTPSDIRDDASRLAHETNTVGRLWEGRQIDDFPPDEDGDAGPERKP